MAAGPGREDDRARPQPRLPRLQRQGPHGPAQGRDGGEPGARATGRTGRRGRRRGRVRPQARREHRSGRGGKGEPDDTTPLGCCRRNTSTSRTWSTTARRPCSATCSLVKTAAEPVPLAEVQDRAGHRPQALPRRGHEPRGPDPRHRTRRSPPRSTTSAAVSNSGEGGEARSRNDVPERRLGAVLGSGPRRAAGRPRRLVHRRRPAQEPAPQPHPPGGLAAGSASTPST